MTPSHPEQSTSAGSATIESEEYYERWKAARAFVEAFATTSTYGGGREAKLWVGDRLFRALDRWKGSAAALDALTDDLVKDAL